MKNEWGEVNKAIRDKAVVAMAQMECQRHDDGWDSAQWFDGKKVNEVLLCQDFLSRYPVKCINGRFFSVDGMLSDGEMERRLYEIVKPYLVSGVEKKVRQIVAALKLEAHADEMPPQLDRIHVANGTYYLNGALQKEKEFCLNRLPVAYNPQAPEPVRWLKFLSELLEPEDIPTLQEFMGYCLLPTNKAQMMMSIIGKGGEGKSRVGLVMRSILGDNMNVSNIQKVETNRFARADLEYKLLMVDDDMKTEALNQTNYIKSIVTMEDKMDMERKGQQSVQGVLYVRFLCFGNGALSALYDRSYGFYRRQLILVAREPQAGRKDDKFLIEKLRGETEGIFLWCLAGLKRLIANGYDFTVSDRARRNLQAAIEDGNNVIGFMNSDGYIRLEKGTMATSKALYQAYGRWCEDNMEKAISARSFSSYLSQNEKKYGIKHSTNIPAANGKNARGFTGVHVQVRTDCFQ